MTTIPLYVPSAAAMVVLKVDRPLSAEVAERIRADWNAAWDARKPDRPVLIVLGNGTDIEIVMPREMKEGEL